MADIDSIESIIKDSDKIKKTSKTKTEKGASGGANTFPNSKQWDIIKYVLGTIVLALIAILYAVTTSYLQVVHDNYLEYSRTLLEINNTRYDKLEIRINNLENKPNATESAK